MKLYKIIATLALTLCLQAQAPVPTLTKCPPHPTVALSSYTYRALSIYPSVFTTIQQIPTIPVRAIYQSKMILRCSTGAPLPDFVKFTTMNFETYLPVSGITLIAPNTYLIKTPIQLMPNILPGLIGVTAVNTQFGVKSQRVIGILR